MGSDIDLDAIESNARAADDDWVGGWGSAASDGTLGPRHWRTIKSVHHDMAILAVAPEPSATHIATADPPTVLALVARIRELEAENAGLRAQLDARPIIVQAEAPTPPVRLWVSTRKAAAMATEPQRDPGCRCVGCGRLCSWRRVCDACRAKTGEQLEARQLADALLERKRRQAGQR